MPLDDTGFRDRVSRLEKIDWVIKLLAPEDRWCKGELVSSDGRQCIMGALQFFDGTTLLVPPILLAVRQVTGRPFPRIEAFNDHRSTTHAMVLAVLYQARENIINGVDESSTHTVSMTDTLWTGPLHRLWRWLGAWVGLATSTEAVGKAPPQSL
jgi:hypothetical protein